MEHAEIGLVNIVVAVQVAIVQYGGAIFATVPLSSLQWITIILVTASVLMIGLVLRVTYGLYRGRQREDG